ncbi:MAG: hypothetical protein E4H29_02060 [Deltaproteobacteria bacterium]|nr:MAG: hypothetical protein E4H29_02060 [Deltaproteobacteria bacterium]
MYQDNVIRVDNLAYTNNGTSDIVTFNMTKAGASFDCSQVTNLNIYFTSYDNTNFVAPGRLSLKATTLTYTAGTNLCTSTKAQSASGDLNARNGIIVVYGYDELVGLLPPSRVRQVAYPYAALLKTGTVNYVSAANVAGCEKCHIIPFLKHGNIYGQVDHVAATDFYTCKACHLDDGDGGHQFWQELVDNPELAAREHNGTLTGADNTFIAANYGYKTSLMNDVHMSHAMEFEYPQSMATCNTCHAGKLGVVLADANFTLETCKSCHPVTGSEQAEKPQPSLTEVIPHIWTDATDCALCHNAGPSGIAPVFSAIHAGYDNVIYGDTAGTKYSSAIVVTIDNASFAGNVLTFGFHATGSLGGLSATSIAPTVSVGLYGFDTKDFLFGPHERTIDSSRDLEYVVGTTHPRFTTVSAAGGAWTVTADLSAWADNIVAGNVRRVEIAVLPKLVNGAGVTVALNAPSKTFDLTTKAFINFYPAIVNVAGCNNCHDALGTSFHSADRGGNIVVCRLCHITKSGGSHLEMASRSIDSYVHVIHTFQAFDIGRPLTNGGTDFDNAVQSMFYDLKIESQFPTFDRQNCQACHFAGKFNVPDQSKSLPGVFSSSWYPLVGWVRNIGTVPSYIAGPASRACGACHRAVMINEDDEVGLASFNSHTRTNGYLLENADILTVIFQVMSNFEETIILPSL